jgi:16S rRNA (uracil1498-N3)-methyltransferase
VRHTFRYLVADAPEAGDEVTLSAADSHHLARVVRRRPGDAVEIIDGAGTRWAAVVVEAGDRARVRVEAASAVRPPPVSVILYQGLIDGGRLDTVVEKSAELGVEEVVVVVTERARRVPGPDTWERRRQRLLRVAESAARQSGQARLPRLRGLVPFPEVVSEIPAGEGFLIDPRGDASLPSALTAREGAPARVSLVVGPEAGFGDAEVALARAAGMAVCGLGGAILRAETAALVAVSLALAAGGALGAGAG